jgi:hypothetical protein
LPIGHNTSSLLLMKNNTRFLKRKKTLKWVTDFHIQGWEAL